MCFLKKEDSFFSNYPFILGVATQVGAMTSLLLTSLDYPPPPYMRTYLMDLPMEKKILTMLSMTCLFVDETFVVVNLFLLLQVFGQKFLVVTVQRWVSFDLSLLLFS